MVELSESGLSQHVGRETELAELTSALDRAAAGRGGIVMLGGEPGIGKTWLLEELESIANERGILAVKGISYEGEGAPPYWPWVQALRSLISVATPPIMAAAESRVSALSELLPELTTLFPEVQPVAQPEDGQARFNLFDSINSFLNEAAPAQPILVILDDLHWADQSTLDLLQFIARNVAANPILLVGGYRDIELSRRHPLSANLASLARNRAFERIPVRGLELENIQKLVESVGGIKLSSELAVEIHERTEGNPFFASEIARDLSANNIDENGFVDAPEFRVPEGVREAIGTRLNRLSDECNQVLRTASVIGREFRFDLLDKMSPNFSTEELLHALEIADTAVVIREVQGESGQYEFAHALIQRTLNEELTTGRRLQLHAQLVEAAEELYDDHLHEHYSQLVCHAREAETIVGSEKVAHYARLAGEMALDSYAWAEARSNFEIATDALPDDASAAELGPVLFGIGTVELQTLTYPEIQSGWDKVAEAFWLYDRAGDYDAAINVAVRSRGFPPFWVHSTFAVFERAVELAPPDSVNAGYLLWSLSRAVRYEQEDSQLAKEILARALKIARDSGDNLLEAQSLTELSMVDVIDGNYEAAIELTDAAIERARNYDVTRLEMFAHFHASAALTALGRSNEALRHAREELEAEGNVGNILGGAWNKFHSAFARGDRKELDELSDLIDTQYPADWVCRIFSSLGAWNIGKDISLTERIVATKEAGRSAKIIFQKSSHAAFLALAAKSLDEPATAKFAGDMGRSLLTETKLTHHNETYARIAAGLDTVATNNADESREHYEWLKSNNSLMVGFHFQFSTERLLGLLAATAGMNTEALAHFESAMNSTKDVGYMLEFAWTCYDYTAVLIRRGQPAELTRARSVVQEGLEQAVALELSAVEERLHELSGTLAQATVDSAVANPANLTDREIEVLRLVTSGRTNQQIADRLVIAPTTAAKHVANILAKTGSANRTEAATFANQHGIADA